MTIAEIVAKSKAALEKEDLEIALSILRERKFSNVLELGMWKGYSAQVWINAFAPTKLVTIDKDKKLEDTEVVENPNYHYLWEMDSTLQTTRDKVVELFDKEPIDFLFIDASHYYQDVLREWKLYSPLVKKGGVILFHDILYIASMCQVNVLWEKIKAEYYYVEINRGWGSTGMGMVFMDEGEPSASNRTRSLKFQLDSV